jgi:hypothetical protein
VVGSPLNATARAAAKQAKALRRVSDMALCF